MQISKAELTPDGIILTVSRDEARRFCYSFKPGEYDIKKTRKNAVWMLTPTHGS